MDNNIKNTKLSDTAKKMLFLLRKRHIASTINNFIDEDGNIYVIFTRAEFMRKCKLSKPTVIKYIKELAQKGFITEKRKGLNKPNFIYLTDKALIKSTNDVKSSQKSESEDKCNKKTLSQKLEQRVVESYDDLVSEKNEIKEKNVRDSSRFFNDFSAFIADIKLATQADAYSKAIRYLKQDKSITICEKSQALFKKLSEKLCKQDLGITNRNVVNAYLELISLTLYKKVMRVSGKIVSTKEFLKKMQKLTVNHLLVIDNKIRNISYKITDIVSYTMSCLYNSVTSKGERQNYPRYLQNI